LVEQVGIFDKGGDDIAVLYFDDGVLAEKSATGPEFVAVLEKDEEGVYLVIFLRNGSDKGIDHLNFFLGIGRQGEQLGDFLEEPQGTDSKLRFVIFCVGIQKKSSYGEDGGNSNQDTAFAGKKWVHGRQNKKLYTSIVYQERGGLKSLPRHIFLIALSKGTM
jgi:hypothetical protein